MVKSVVGKDFFYGKFVSSDQQPSCSHSSGSQNKEEQSELIPNVQEFLDQEALSQAEILATVQNDTQKKTSETKDDGDDDILILEPSVFNTSMRQGGIVTEYLTGKNTYLNMSESSSDDEEDFVEVAKQNNFPAKIGTTDHIDAVLGGGSPSESSSDEDDFVEVEQANVSAKTPNVVQDNESTSSGDDDFVEVDNQDKAVQDDLFADVFSSSEAHKTLDNILAGKKLSKDHKNISSSKITKDAKPLENNTDANLDVNSKELESSAEKPNIAAAMKGQNHLFLKIASKWAEDVESVQKNTESPGIKSITENKNQRLAKSSKKEMGNSKAQSKEEVDFMLETDQLVKEMREKVNKERLLKAKGQLSKALPLNKNKNDDSSKLTSKDISEEDRVLSSLNVNVADKTDYDNSIIKQENIDDEDYGSPSKVQPDSVVYGASAPGFVRSKKFNVVEVEHSNDVQVLDERITVKLEAIEENEETTLTTDELLVIQVRN